MHGGIWKYRRQNDGHFGDGLNVVGYSRVVPWELPYTQSLKLHSCKVSWMRVC